VARRFPEEGLTELRQYCDVHLWDKEDTAVPPDLLAQELSLADAAIISYWDRITPAILDQSPNLRMIANYANGYDNIPLPACTSRGIMVANTPIGDASVADLTMTLLLTVARRVVEAHRLVLSGQWLSWSPLLLAGQEVNGSTLGIIGMGKIGKQLAKRARAFDMQVLYHNRKPTPEAAETDAEYVSLQDLLRRSDFVCILVPLTRDTYHLIGAAELALMKPTAVLINTSRGPVVDERALYRALSEKRLWGAAIDVFEVEPPYHFHPLLQLDNVVVTPHIGSCTIANRVNMIKLSADNVLAALRGDRPPTLVNQEAWDRFQARQMGVTSA
jgi:glyoxylate reductase